MGFPAVVVELDELGATVRLAHERRRVSTFLLPEVEVGDQVFIAGRSIVQRLDPDEAERVRELLFEAMALEDTEASGV
jgi:hydrogenase maturation factor